MREDSRSASPASDTDDDFSHFLSDPYTRHVLWCLHEEGGTLSLQTLSRRVAARATDTPPGEVDDAVRRQVEIFLHHGHLPTLVDRGILAYDPDGRYVSLDDSELDSRA